MTMQGEQPAGGLEPKTADSRSFYIQDMAIVALQEEITQMTADLRSQESPILRLRCKSPIMRVTEGLQDAIVSAGGVLVMSGLQHQLERLAEYEVTEHGSRVARSFAVPRDRITGVSVLSRWYDTGHDVRPVINFRIQTDQDLQKTRTIHRRPESWGERVVCERTCVDSDGRWHQLVIGEGIVHLAGAGEAIHD